MSTIKAANIQNPSAASAAIVLDTSGNFSVPAGTVSAPGIQAPSDSNTGIFFPAADTIAFAEGGTEAMRIDSSSRLLVGTSTASGNNVLQVNTDALINGNTVGRGNNSGVTNTALGNVALSNNDGNNQNTAIGEQALKSNTSGARNTAVGKNALRDCTTSSNNTAIGVDALIALTTTSPAQGGNVAVGDQSGRLISTGTNNTVMGYLSAYSLTTGADNTAIGMNALRSTTTSNGNVSIGLNSLYSNTTGATNTAVGQDAGYGVGTNSNTTGSNNTFIGYQAVGSSATASNVITLGNGSIATLRCQVTTITSLSDKRDKTNIANLGAGLDFVNKLRPVSFTWNTRDRAKVGIEDCGFIAQELLAVQGEMGITIPNLVSQENPEKLEAGYGTLIPVLVNAVQELTTMVKQLQDEITTLKGAN